MRTPISLFVLTIIFAASSLAQETETAYCNYDDGNQVSIQYNPSVKEQPRNGRVWSPGITLYVQVPLKVGGSEIGLGAYTVHLIPDRKEWTLIVNKNVTARAIYNPAQDVARAPMEIGEIPDPMKTLQLSFAHISAKQCSLRVYYQKIGAFADFTEK
jgi:ribosomal protein L21E